MWAVGVGVGATDDMRGLRTQRVTSINKEGARWFRLGWIGGLRWNKMKWNGGKWNEMSWAGSSRVAPSLGK